MAKKRENKTRRRIQLFLLWIVVVTIMFGWEYPYIGFVVPVVMIAGIIGGMFRGRYVCGNLCPRGSFLDRAVSIPSRKQPIPGVFRGMLQRWVVFALLMGLMVFRVLQDPTSLEHWGRVFWLMCAVTTAIAVVLGVLINPRSWCAFCPIGTAGNVLGRKSNYRVRIKSDLCKRCSACEKACPFDIPILEDLDKGVVQNHDCLKCGECIAACPFGVLSWNEEEAEEKEDPSDQSSVTSDRVRRRQNPGILDPV